MDPPNPRYGPPSELYRSPHSWQQHSKELVQPRSQTETFHQGKMGPPPPAPIPIDPSLVPWANYHRPAYFSHAAPPIHDSRIGQRLQERSLSSHHPGGLDAIPISILESRTGDLESNPLVRFWHEDGPWYPQGLGVGQPPVLPHHVISHERSKSSHPSHGRYRDPAGTALEGRLLGRQLSDSGYGTQSHVASSVLGTDYRDQVQENQSLASDTDRTHGRLENVPRDYLHEAAEEAQSFAIDDCSNDSPEPGSMIPLLCDHPDCGVTLKNQSEYRKHRQRHDKLFVCEERDCTRRQKGFSTKNDLERHKKSVHKIVPTNIADKSFQCKGRNCTKRDKIWPRLDNFRSHGRRVHKHEDLDDLVKMSEIDSTISPIHDELGRRARSHPSRLTYAPKDLDQIRGDSSPELERTYPEEHLSQEGIREFTMPNAGSSNTTQLPVIATFDKMNLAIDSRVDLDDARHSQEQSQSAQESYYSHSPVTKMSTQPVFEANEVSLSRSASQRYVASSRSRTDDAATSTPQSMPPARVRIPPAGQRVSGKQAEQLSKAIAAGINKYMNQPASEEMQNIIQKTVFNIFNPCSLSKRTVEDAGLDNPPEALGKRVACSICPKIMDRPCDIKKHEKRHRRPYGCTHATCTKAFGSKNDWKRHENSQHYQLETWRCHEPNPQSKINQCARIFYRRDPFQAHLRKDHNVTDDEYIRDQCKRGRIGRNGQSGFWCGFCKEIVKLEKRGLEAWDERFNHIDDDHFKSGERIEDWYPLDKDIPKGLLGTENILDSGGRSATLDGSEDEDSDGGPACNRSSTAWTTVRQKPSKNTLVPTPPSSIPLQPAALHDVDNANPIEQSRSNKRQKTSSGYEWYCCKCKMGPHNAHIVVSCWGDSCNEHRICPHCKITPVPGIGEI